MELDWPMTKEAKEGGKHVNLCLIATRLVRDPGLEGASRQGAKPLATIVFLSESCRGFDLAQNLRGMEDVTQLLHKGVKVPSPPWILTDCSIAETNAVIMTYNPQFRNTREFLAAIEEAMVDAAITGAHRSQEWAALLPTQPMWDVNHVNHAAYLKAKRIAAAAGTGRSSALRCFFFPAG
jgi:hypothetical protein